MPFLQGLRTAMWFSNNDHGAVFQAKTRRDTVASLGPVPWSQGPRLELEKCTTAMAANTALMVPLTLMVTPEGKYYLPSCVQVQSL